MRFWGRTPVNPFRRDAPPGLRRGSVMVLVTFMVGSAVLLTSAALR